MDILLGLPLAGDLERFLSEDLYPYRYPLTIAAIVGVIAALFIAYRLDVHIWAWKRRVYTGPALVLFLAVFIPISYFLVSPLWDRSTVCEASPIAGAGSGSEKCDDDGVAVAATNPPTSEPTDAPADPTDAPAATDVPSATDAPSDDFEAHVVKEGTFEGADDFHYGEGNALLIESEPGVYILRFEEFSVRNGPDLFVYLSPDPETYTDGALKLGELKATDGAFNYEIPPGTDVSQFASAIVWCDAFSVLFATATF